MLEPEKKQLKIVFIPIVCSAPLIYAHSHGFFEKNGLHVDLIKVPGWGGAKELLVYDHADAAHLLSPMPLACNLGIDGKKADIRLVSIQNVNGQALTLANKHRGIKDVRDMKRLTFGVPYRFSMHYYLLCYYLAANGINPLKDVTINEVAPPNMPFYLKKGWVDGVFAPEPFNQISIYQDLGFIHILSKDIWAGHPCCSFTVTQGFMDRYPNTYQLMLRSVLEAELALHNAGVEERKKIAREMSDSLHLDQKDPTPVEQAFSGEYPDGKGGLQLVPDRVDFIPYPWMEYGQWMLSQMQRWSQLPGKIDYREVVESVFQTHETRELAEALGFSREVRPNLNGIDTFQGDEAYTYMTKQPYCSFQEELRPLIEPDLPETVRDHISEIIRHMAEVSGGNLEQRAEVNVGGEIGRLQQLFNEIIFNMKFMRDNLTEQNEKLQKEFSVRKQIQIRLEKEFTAIASVLNDMLLGEGDDAQTEKKILDACLDATDSVYGMIGIINERGQYDTTTYSSRTLQDCAFPEALAWEMSTGMPIRGIWGWPLLHGKPLLCNDLKTHPDRIGFPKGHVPLNCFLGVPLKHDGKTVGMVAVANKPGGYTQDDKDTLIRLASVASVSQQHRSALKAAEKISGELEHLVEERTKQLREVLDHLEELVRERTAEVTRSNELLQFEITERKRAEEELLRAKQAAEMASRAKSEFLASMSHELRTPLNAVIGFSEVLQDKYFGPLTKKQEGYVKDILESGKHLLSLINDILDLSKVEAGKMELDLSQVRIKSFLEGSLTMIKEKALKHEITIDLQIPESLSDLEIKADQRKIKQVAFNLLANAAKFTPDGGGITIAAEKDGNELIISISDTGIGIAPDEQEKIFDEFYQATGAGRGKTPGTGLGLPLARQFVELHGGRLWVESEGQGKGSRFSFSLPLETGSPEKRDL